MAMDLMSQLDALGEQKNVTERTKGDFSVSPVDPNEPQEDPGLTRLKRVLTNSNHVDEIDGAIYSKLQEYQKSISEYDKEISYRQDLLNNPQPTDNIDILKKNIEYTVSQRNRLQSIHDQLDRAKVDPMALFESPKRDVSKLPTTAVERGFATSSKGIAGSLAAASQSFAETLGAEDTAKNIGELRGIAFPPEDPNKRPIEWGEAEGVSGVSSYIGESVGSAIPWLLAGGAGTKSVIALGGAVGQGSMREALEREGVTDKASIRKASYIYGTLVGGLQAIVPAMVAGGWSQKAISAFEGSLGQVAAKMAAGTSNVTATQLVTMQASTIAEHYGVTSVTGKPFLGQELADKLLESSRQALIQGPLFGAVEQGGKYKAGAYKVGEGKGAEAPQELLDKIPQPEMTAEQMAAVKEAMRNSELADLATQATPEAEARRAEIRSSQFDERAKAEVEIELLDNQLRELQSNPGLDESQRAASEAEINTRRSELLAKIDEINASEQGVSAESMRNMRAKIESEYSVNPESVERPDPYSAFGEMAASLTDEISNQFQVHGIATGSPEVNLLDLLKNGIDEARGFNAGPPKPGTQGIDTTRTTAPYLLLSEPGKSLVETGVKYIVLNGPAAAVREALQPQFLDKVFMNVPEAAEFMRTGRLPEAVQAPEPVAATAITLEERTAFVEALRNGVPRKEWVRELGTTPERLTEIIADAKDRGVVRVDRRGYVRRTSKTFESEQSQPVQMPDGEVVVKTEVAQEKWTEMQGAVSEAVSEITDGKIRVVVEDKIENSRATSDQKFSISKAGNEESLGERVFGPKPPLSETGKADTRFGAGTGRGASVSTETAGGGSPGRTGSPEPRIFRREAATLREDGPPVIGRIERGEGGGRSDNNIQREGTVRKLSMSSEHDALVEAKQLHAGDAREGTVAKLEYLFYDKGKVPQSAHQGNSKADIVVKQHQDGAWEVEWLHVAPGERGKKLASKAYAAIEKDLGIRLSPSGVLTDDGLAFWKKRSPESVKWHQKVPGEEGTNFSPRMIKDEMERLSSKIKKVNDRTYLSARDKRELTKAWNNELASLKKMWANLPKEAKAQEVTDSMFSLRGFYSPAIRSAESISMKKGTGEQFWKQITKTPGVKKDELEWMGLEEFLKGKKSITKDEVLGFMRAHQIVMSQRSLDETPSTLPIKSVLRYLADVMDSTPERIREEYGYVNDEDYLTLAFDSGYEHDGVVLAKFSSYKVPGGDNYRELLIRLPALEGKYTSKHFRDQEIVHIRIDDRAGPNGEKVLFLNEVQSDLHQQGRRFGYDTKERRALEKNLADKNAELEAEYFRLEAEQKSVEADAVWQEKLKIDEKYKKLRFNPNIAPEAPFKGDLWLELALKRVLYHAVEQGYDAISWARSDQIARAVGAEPEKLALQYDQKIGKFLDKYTKKWEGKIEKTAVIERPAPVDHAFQRLSLAMEEHPSETSVGSDLRRVWNEWVKAGAEDSKLNDVIGEIASPENRAAVIKAIDSVGAGRTNQILRITPQMRVSVMEGQPLSARDGGTSILAKADPDNLIIRIAAKAIEAEAARTGRSPIAEAIRTARHETLEMAKALGLITEKEWATFTATAKEKGWVETQGVRDAYEKLYKEGVSKDKLEDIIVKEAIMEQFADHESGVRVRTGVVGKVFDRILNFFRSVASKIRSITGATTAEDIFHSYNTGELKKRFAAELPDLANENLDQLFAARAQQPTQPPSPLDTAMADIRAELGLQAPQKPWKKSKAITPRQQAVAIAHAGGEELLRLYGKEIIPALAPHAKAIESMAMPWSDKPFAEGFSTFFRDFILRPDNLRRREQQLHDDFRDALDASSPILLEAIDKMQDMARDRVRDMSSGKLLIPGVPDKSTMSWLERNVKPTAIYKSTIGSLSKATEIYKRNFQPELVSDKAMMADAKYARYKSSSAQEKDATEHAQDHHFKWWSKKTMEERMQYMHDIEIGAAQPTKELAKLANRDATLLKQSYLQEQVWGSRAGYLEDYFPHIWKDPDKARKFIKTVEGVMGPTWFQKARHYETIQKGLEAGLELKSTNPAQLVTWRLLSGIDMRMRMELLAELKKLGTARETKGLNETQLYQLENAGWESVRAPNMEHWLISPDTKSLWANAVAAKGLWGNEGAAGSLFRSWMAFKNVWVPIKLSISAFHPLHVMHINFSHKMSLAWDRLVSTGDIVGALKGVVTSMGQTQGIGFDMRMAWIKKPEERTPYENALVRLMNDGGFVPQLSEQLRIDAGRKLTEAIGQGQYIKALPLVLRRTVEVMQGRIFERWIPGLKAAAYLQQAQLLLEKNPWLLNDDAKRQVALRSISKSIDNRFGEMFYGNLFWNRVIKDAGIASFLSLGWNLGFAREFLGAPLKALAYPYKKMFLPSDHPSLVAAEANNKIAFSLIYLSSFALFNGIATAIFTGEAPTGYDFIFMRIGGKNPDGSDRRTTNMSYLREIPMYMKHAEERNGYWMGAFDMVANKLMFQPFVEMYNNKDYWGYPMWNEDDPLVKKTSQFVGHVLKNQFSPITFSGAGRAAELSGTYKDKSVPMSFLGFGPAPAYIERSKLENRIRTLFKKYGAADQKPFEQKDLDEEKRIAKLQLRRAIRDGDEEGAREARARAKAAGATSATLTNKRLATPSGTFLFSRLPVQIQANLMREMTTEELKVYRKYANKKARRQFPIQISE